MGMEELHHLLQIWQIFSGHRANDVVPRIAVQPVDGANDLVEDPVATPALARAVGDSGDGPIKR